MSMWFSGNSSLTWPDHYFRAGALLVLVLVLLDYRIEGYKPVKT